MLAGIDRERDETLIRAAKWILAVGLAVLVCFGLVACSGDDDDGAGGETTAAQTAPENTENGGATGSEGGDEAGGSETTENGESAAGEGEDGAGEADQPARSEEIDELLTMHPIFSTKRFMNFAARGDGGACSLLSDKGRQAMERAHGMPCPQVIRAAAADREEPGLTIGGEFVPIDEFSDLEFPTTIYVLKREMGRVTVEGENRPIRLSKYGRIWLIDAIPLADIGTVS